MATFNGVNTRKPDTVFAIQVRQPRGVMPRYPAQFVSDQYLADIYSYVASDID